MINKKILILGGALVFTGLTLILWFKSPWRSSAHFPSRGFSQYSHLKEGFLKSEKVDLLTRSGKEIGGENELPSSWWKIFFEGVSLSTSPEDKLLVIGHIRVVDADGKEKLLTLYDGGQLEYQNIWMESSRSQLFDHLRKLLAEEENKKK